MTIDESIEKFKFIANSDTPCPRYCMLPCDKCVDESKQLSEWLEELKMLRELKDEHRKIGNIEGFNKGYNKAIDDFVKFASDMPTVEEEDGEIRPMWLKEMAEQLKAGGKYDD